MLRSMRATILAALFLALAPVAFPQSLAGRWDATVKVDNLDIPFRFELAGGGSNVQGFFFNGEERYPSTSGRAENDSLALKWDYFASRIQATVHDGTLDGQYLRSSSAGLITYPFHAKRYSGAPASTLEIPQIGGIWIIPTKSPKGESAWRFIVRQSGGEVSAAILRVDGDTGALTGSYRDGKFVLSHFSGVRPALLEVSVTKDGALEMLQNGKAKLTAARVEQARAQGLAEPTDPSHHTSVRNPEEPFQFRFPDLTGKLVSNTDARFRGKVVLVNIAGSWCPNCHDETPFLVELYRKYHAQGLEIVMLDFEEPEQLKDPARLRAFIQKYGIEYTVLIGGETSEAKDKLTQAVNWNAWPTTFFLGRDGLVRGVHAGFPSSASGDLHRQAKEEFAAKVESLLKENLRTAR
jgi:thiol-disulfide isomerase/thioredoxin